VNERLWPRPPIESKRTLRGTDRHLIEAAARCNEARLTDGLVLPGCLTLTSDLTWVSGNR
jgi:hypothetical protein